MFIDYTTHYHCKNCNVAVLHGQEHLGKGGRKLCPTCHMQLSTKPNYYGIERARAISNVPSTPKRWSVDAYHYVVRRKISHKGVYCPSKGNERSRTDACSACPSNQGVSDGFVDCLVDIRVEVLKK